MRACAHLSALAKSRLVLLIWYRLTWVFDTHTHPFNGPFSGTTRVSRYQKGKTNLDFTKARDSEWQWHQLGRMQVCTSLQTDNHASTLPLSFLQSGCPSCHPTNSVEALKGCMCFDNFDIYLICVTRPHCFAECKTLPIVTIVASSVCLLVTRELCKNG